MGIFPNFLSFFFFSASIFNEEKDLAEQQLNTDKWLMIEQIFCHRHRRDTFSERWVEATLAPVVMMRRNDKNFFLFPRRLFPLVSDDRTQHSRGARSQRAFYFASFRSTMSVGVLMASNIYGITMLLRAQFG